MQGRADPQREILDVESVAGHLLPVGGVFAFLAGHRHVLFPEAMFADLFVGPATNVYVFFTDLLGMKEAYNVPGSTSEENWSLRVPPDYERLYRERALRGEALDLGRVLALALAARGAPPSSRPHGAA